MFCPKCGNEVKEGASFCGRCGHALRKMSGGGGRSKRKVLLAVAVALIVVAVAVGGWALLGSGVRPKGSVDEYTWEELSEISAEIGEAGSETEAIEVAKKYHLVGDDGKLDGSRRKSVTLANGINTSVQIVGFAHDNKSDGSGKAGITFIFSDAIAEQCMNSEDTNAGGWEGSEMRAWLSSSGMALLPNDLRNEIVAVDKMTNNVGDTLDASSATATSDKLWLLSFWELCGDNNDYDFDPSYAALYNAEGSQYKYCRDIGLNVDEDGYASVERMGIGAWGWWVRTPVPDDPAGYIGCEPDFLSYHYANEIMGVVPGFCI